AATAIIVSCAAFTLVAMIAPSMGKKPSGRSRVVTKAHTMMMTTPIASPTRQETNSANRSGATLTARAARSIGRGLATFGPNPVLKHITGEVGHKKGLHRPGACNGKNTGTGSISVEGGEFLHHLG